MTKDSVCVKCEFEGGRHHPQCSEYKAEIMPMPAPGYADKMVDPFHVAWQVWDRHNPNRPTTPGKYVVIVDHGRFGLPFVTTRTWTGQRWDLCGPHDIISHWLDGLEMP